MASFRWAFALVACAVAFSGCSSDPGASHPHGCALTASTDCGPGDTRIGGPVVVPGAHGGGTVTVLTHTGLRGSLDPSDVHVPDLLSIDRGLLTRALTQYRYDPKSRRMVLVPDLATDLGSSNDDFTQWRFYLRRGVEFENGARVTPADVVRGIRRCLDASRFPASPCRDVPIGSVYAKGRDIRLRFDEPFPDLPYVAAFPALGPVPGHADPTTYRLHPLATGPYRIARYRPGHRLVLTRNPRWDPKTDPGRTQYPSRYVFRAGLPERAIARTLRRDTGDGQTTLTYDQLSPRVFRALTRTAADRVVRGPSGCTTYVAPDSRTVRSPLVRRALALAYPYRAIVRLDGLVPGVTALPASTLTPPGVPGRRGRVTGVHRGFRTDPLAARTLLRKAGALAFPIRFRYDPHSPVSVSTSEALVRALVAAGFRAVPQQQSPAVDLRTATRCGAWPAGSQWVPPLFGSKPPNLAAFSRTSVDRELAHIRAFPLEKQVLAYAQVEHRILRRWSPAFPVYYGGVDMVHGSRIGGMTDDDTLGMPAWQRLWVTR